MVKDLIYVPFLVCLLLGTHQQAVPDDPGEASLNSLLLLNLDEFECNSTPIEKFDLAIFELYKWMDIIHNMPDIENDVNVLHGVAALIDQAK